MLSRELQGGGAVIAFDDLEAAKLEDRAQELAVALVIFDHQDGAFHQASMGSVNVKVDPDPGALSTVIVPPCSSTSLRVSVSPSPVPSALRA